MPVAKIVEEVFFIDTASPYTEHVHIGIDRIHDSRFILFGSNTRQEVILRDIVGTFHEYRHTIQFEVKRMTVFVRLIDDADTADTDVRCVAVGNLVVHADRGGEWIQMRFTQTVRPPEFRIVDGQLRLDHVGTFFHLCLFRPVVFDTVCFDVKRYFSVFVRNDLYAGFNIGTFGGYVGLVIEDIVDARIVPSDQINRAPDTAGDDTWTPVPTIMITGFPGKDTYLFVEDTPVLRLVVACFDGEL